MFSATEAKKYSDARKVWSVKRDVLSKMIAEAIGDLVRENSIKGKYSIAIPIKKKEIRPLERSEKAWSKDYTSAFGHCLTGAELIDLFVDDEEQTNIELCCAVESILLKNGYKTERVKGELLISWKEFPKV